MQSVVGVSCQSQGPWVPFPGSQVSGSHVPSPRVPVPWSRVLSLRSQGPGSRISGLDFRQCHKFQYKADFNQIINNNNSIKSRKWTNWFLLGPGKISFKPCFSLNLLFIFGKKFPFYNPFTLPLENLKHNLVMIIFEEFTHSLFIVSAKPV